MLKKLMEEMREQAGLSEEWTDYRGRKRPGDDPREKQRKYKQMHEFTRAMNEVWRELWIWYPHKDPSIDGFSEYAKTAVIELKRHGYVNLKAGAVSLTDKGIKKLRSGGNKI